MSRAVATRPAWRATPIERRQALLSRAVDLFVELTPAVAEELTWQMGRPLTQSPGEMRGFAERARYMIDVAPRALAVHVDEVAALPPGAVVLDSNDPSGVQAADLLAPRACSSPGCAGRS